MRVKLLSLMAALMSCLLSSALFAAHTINSVTLNGSSSVTVNSGGTITVAIQVTTSGNGANDDWESTEYTLDGSTTCVDTTNYDGDGTYTETFDITAPVATGTYSIIITSHKNGGCNPTDDSVTLSNAITVASGGAALLAHYKFDICDWTATGIATDSVGSYDGVVTGNVGRNADATSGIKPDTCSSALLGGGAIDITGLPVSTGAGAKTSVSFWMFWDGSNSVMPIGWQIHDLWLVNGSFGFNTGNSDIYGISSSGLANGWHHVVAVFTNENVTANALYIDGVAQPLSQRLSSPSNSRAVVDSHMRIGGWWRDDGYRFSQSIDEVKIYNGEVTQAQVNADLAYVASSCPSCPPPPTTAATLIAEYDFDDDWHLTGSLTDTEGSFDGVQTGSVGRVSAPASGIKPDTCFAGDFNGGAFDIDGLPVSTTFYEKTSVSFWMYWDGTNSVMPMGWQIHDLWLVSGVFGFNTGNGDVYGISSAGLENSWHHVAVVFNNNNITNNEIYIDGVAQTLTQLRSSPSNVRAIVDPHMRIGGWWYNDSYRFRGMLDELKVYTGGLTQAEVERDRDTGCNDAIAWWTMDENQWDGTAGEVLDEMGNGYSGTAVNGLVNDNADSAVAGNPGTCRYGDFDGSNDYIQIDSSLPDLTGSFTVLGWINARELGKDQRIFADDETNKGGFAFSLGDGGNGKLRFFSRDVSPISVDTQNAVISSDSWYFVAAVHDAAAKTRQIYVNGTAVALNTGGTSSIYTGVWGSDPGSASIGGETNSAGDEAVSNWRFNGFIDEVRVYEAALSDAEIGQVMSETHPCVVVSGPDHLEVVATVSASTCVAKEVTVRACADAGCSSIFTDYVGAVDLSTSTSRGNWATSGSGSLNPDPDDDNNGAVSYAFSVADAGSVTMHLSNASADDLTVTAIDTPNSLTDTSGTISFRDNAFVITDDDTLSGADLAVAGRNHSYSVTLYQRDTSQTPENCAIASGYSGNKNLKSWVTRTAALPSALAPQIGAAVLPNSVPGTDNLNLNFSNGVAGLSLTTSDVGQFAINLRDDSRTFASAVDIDGTSTNLTVRPFGFDIDFSGQRAADWLDDGVLNNSTGSNSSYAVNENSSVFSKAGELFVTSLRAVVWQNNDDLDDDGIPDTNANLSGNASVPNFGQEQPIAEQVAISHSLVAPSGGSNGTYNGSPVSGFSGGAANINSSWSEVGIINLAASLTDNDYLGSGSNVIGEAINVGRFVPEHFVVDNASIINRVDSSCAIPSIFTYMDEPFQASFRVTAQNLANGTTTNYVGSFAKLDSFAELDFGALSAGSSNETARLADDSSPAFSWTNGVLNYDARLSFIRQSPEDGPYEALQIGIAPTDEDSVTTTGFNLDIDGNSTDDHVDVGATNIRYGRLIVNNAFGPEPLDLDVRLHTEYYDGLNFVLNTDDSCSTFVNTDASLSNYTGNLASVGTTVDQPVTPTALVNGRNPSSVPLLLAAPGIGNDGTVTVTLAVPSWLQFNSSNPSGLAVFGSYRGNDRIIYWRERFD